MAAVIASAAVLAVSCGTDLSSTKEESRTVLTVAGYDVPYEMYRYAAGMHLRDRLDVSSADAEKEGFSVADATAKLSDNEKKEIADQVKADAIETLTEIYSLFAVAKQEGIDPFGEMINELTDMEMTELRASYEDDEEYVETLALYNMNHSVYTLLTRYEIVSDRLYEKYVKDGKIDRSDEAAIEYMMGDGSARAKQILISFERHSEEEAERLAKEISATVKSQCIAEDGTVDEEKFDELTDKYGEDLFMFKNRDGYYISRGYNDREFEKAVFGMNVGEIADPVRISAGYSIILRAPKDPEYIKENIGTLKEAVLTGIYRGILEEYSADVEIGEAEGFAKIDIYSMK